MNRQQVNTLLEILADLRIGDNTVEQPLDTAMKDFYASLIANSEGKPLYTIQNEFDKKLDLLRWKLGQAFRNSHKKELAKVNKKLTAPPPTNEKEYTIAEVAGKLKMTTQNLNNHLKNNPEIKVKILSPRKRYLTDSEFKKLKQKLRISV
jgi:hypothetical protein